MPLSSMTGFARHSGHYDGYQWCWEVKTVNNKGLDVRAKVPPFLDGYDIAAKKIVTGLVSRGSVFLALSVEREKEGDTLKIDEGKLSALLQIAQKYADTEGVENASLDGLLALKGVVDVANVSISDKERESLEKALTAGLKELMAGLQESRHAEGERMQAFLTEQLNTLKGLTKDASTTASTRLEAMQNRFTEQVNKLLQDTVNVDESRLAQEIAVLAVKADVQEEIDRLHSHFEEAEKFLSSDKPVGRKLDFLCQEFNREVNTLCSKSSDTELTKIGIQMKTVIDQFREQVQNIE